MIFICFFTILNSYLSKIKDLRLIVSNYISDNIFLLLILENLKNYIKTDLFSYRNGGMLFDFFKNMSK